MAGKQAQWAAQAERPTMENNLQYHIRCGNGDVAEYVLLPGDPNRVPIVAGQWDEAHKVAEYREHVTYTGKVGGVDISACSTGAGGMSCASTIEELAEIGAKTMIRVGTCAALQDFIKPGDLIINTAAVRHDGSSDQYVEMNYPAAADVEVTMALVRAARELGIPYHMGVGYSHGAFYCGVGRHGYGGYTQSWIKNIQPDMKAARVLNFEAEAATLFTLCSLFGLRSGCVATAVVSFSSNRFEYKQEAIDQNLQVANRAVQILAHWEEEKAKSGQPHIYPTL